MPALAAGTLKFKVTADKTEANPGDIITYTVSMSAVEDIESIRAQLVIPEGLTYQDPDPDKNVIKITSITDADSAEYTESTKIILVQCMAGYTSAADTVLFTLQYKVNDGANGSLKVDITVPDYEEIYNTDYDNIPFTTSGAIVEVKAKPVAVSGVTLDKDTLSLTEGNNETLVATANPDAATNKTVTWESSDTSVATVNQTGKVVAVAKGEAVITVKTADGNFTDTCTVTVNCAHINLTPTAAKTNADCQHQNHSAYWTCAACGQMFSDATGTTEISAIPYTDYGAHSYTATTQKSEALKTAGTCKDEAVYYYSCSACGAVENNDSHTFKGEKNASNHTDSTTLVNKTDATCQAPGYTGDTKCNGCNQIISTGSATPQLSHNPGSWVTSDPDKHWKVCSVGGEKMEEGDHTFVVVADTGHEPTEDAAGIGHEECTVCYATGRTGVTIPKLDHTHNLTKIEAKAATCTAEGNNEYYRCTKCGLYYKDSTANVPTTVAAETIDANGHTNGAPVRENEVAATCTTAGSYDEVIYCTVCTAEVSRSNKPIAKTAHKYTASDKDANQHWKKCADCGAVDDTSKENHKGGSANCCDRAICEVCSTVYGSTNSTVHKTPTNLKYETNNNGTHNVKYACCNAVKETVNCSGGTATCKELAECEHCHTAYGSKNPANHSTYGTTTKNAKEATCTVKGYTGDEHCNGCDAIITPGSDIDMVVHTYGAWEKDTATQHKHTCTKCGTATERADHNFGAGVETKPATCTETGVLTYTCTDCGETKTSPIDKIAHDWEVMSLAELNDEDEIEYAYIFATDGKWLYFPVGDLDEGLQDLESDLNNDSISYGSKYDDADEYMENIIGGMSL